jgi:hypothetical protein
VTRWARRSSNSSLQNRFVAGIVGEYSATGGHRHMLQLEIASIF